ncbi:hypothetical protein AU377_06345 [Sporosarcina sp. HYO08]|nr:hypothetical protein AU377_06345 [Sporosarcina sp. HYO08]
MDKEQIPGVAVAVSVGGQVVYEQGFGKRNLETMEPVTPDTIFGIASVTKSFTALAIMKLAEEGKVQIHKPVVHYLPDFKLCGYKKSDQITIHHLLSHTTGVGSVERKEQLTNLEEHLRYLAEKKLDVLGDPGAHMSYNNDLFLLLGAIIEKVTGEHYKTYITKQIIEPLRMNRTTFDLEQLRHFENVSVPYVFNSGRPTKCAWPTLGNYAVGGGIRSSVKDLLKYGQLYLHRFAHGIVSKKTTDIMAKPVHRTQQNRHYGYGLHITPRYGEVTLVEHGGGQPGVSSNFGFIPEKEIVVAVLTNVSGVSADAIWLAAANNALGLPLDRKRYTAPQIALDEGQLKGMVGCYASDEGYQVEIELEEQGLVAQIDQNNFPLCALSRQSFVMMPNEKPLEFVLNEKNEVWALFFGLRLLVKRPVGVILGE